MNQEIYKDFLWFIQEREKIRKFKEAGYERPWTEDPILQEYRFTNIWRQDDKVTKLIQSRLEGLVPIDKVLNAIWLRSINNYETIQQVQLAHWQREFVSEGDVKFGNAYVTVPSWKLNKGQKRLDAIVKFINEVREEVFNMKLPLYAEDDLKKLLRPRGWFVGLPRYEIMLDIWQTLGMYEQYCNVGPGAEWTLKTISGFSNKPDERDVRVLLSIVLNDLPDFFHERWGQPTMRCIEGACCEYRKYHNLKTNPKARKRKFVCQNPLLKLEV